MNRKILELKVRDRVWSIMNSPKYRDEFNYLVNELGISKDDIANAVVAYDVYTDEMQNKQYSSHAMRAAIHTLFLAEGSYHNIREQAVIDYLKKSESKSACDIGFGVPTRWVFELALCGKMHASLIDKDSSAQEFAEKLISYRDTGNNAGKFVSYKTLDMDDGEYPGDYGAYILMDSLEHTKDPQKYLDMLISKSPRDSFFILSLPIGPLAGFSEHFHYIEWLDNEDAKDWLQQRGLLLIEEREAVPSPEVDLFIHSLNISAHNLIVLCEKS